MVNPVLQVRNLRTSFGKGDNAVIAVDDVSFDIAEGEIVGIVGESGCGKSVTASSILRLVPSPGHVVGGEILFNGRDVLKMNNEELRRFRGNDVSMIFQDPMSSLNPVMKVGAQIEEAMRVHGMTDSRLATERATALMSGVRIPAAAERLDDYPHQFSGGMRQRIMIAMGLANEPALLLADEPTTALDVTVQAQIMDLLRDLNRETRTAIMLITHNISVVANLCTRMIVMYAGRIVEEGPTQEVLRNPQHPYTWSLLRAAPKLENQRGSALLTIEGMPPNLAALPGGCRFAPRCRFADETCHTSEPDLVSAEGDRAERCWHPMRTLPVRDRQEAADPIVVKSRRHDPEAAPLLSVRDVAKTFTLGAGVTSGKRTLRAVDGVSFDVHSGETLGLVGESGCGKSTLGRVLMNLEPPTEGKILFNGEDLTTLSARAMRERRRDLQMVFQDSHASLNPRRTVEQIIAEPLRNLGGVPAKDIRKAVLDVMDVCGLPSRFLHRHPHEFSGGQRQRIGIARALILKPKLIIADEPISALDVSIQAQIVNLFQELQREFQLTYVFISHDLSVVRHIADRVAVMYLGRIVELGSADDIYDNPQHPYTQLLLSSIPRLDGAGEGAPPAASGELPSPLSPPSGCRFHTRCPLAVPGLCDVETPRMRRSLSSGAEAACHLIGEMHEGQSLQAGTEMSR